MLFGPHMWLVGFQFTDQGWNPGHSGGQNLTLGHQNFWWYAFKEDPIGLWQVYRMVRIFRVGMRKTATEKVM